VALTAGAFADDRQQCLDAGMDDVLTKPIAMERLQATLAHWLGRAPSAVQAQDSAAVLTHKAVDVAHIRTLLLELMPLLAHSKFASIASFRKLQDALSGTALADEMTHTAGLLQEFRFDLVQQRLLNIAAPQGYDITV
jgi:DNA-binding response OmpR family regulator